MNGYNLSRAWFDFRFENPDICSSVHTELYLYACDLWNRFGQKEKFGLPSLYTMEMLGIKSKNTFYNTLNDLVSWGFLEYIQKSKNQNTSTIIKVCNTSADSKNKSALDTANIQQASQQEYNSEVSTGNIDKQYNKETKEQRNNILYEGKIFTLSSAFDLFWKEYPKKVGKEKARTRFEEAMKRQGVDFEIIIKGLIAYKKDIVSKKTEKIYIKNPEGRLNQGYYANEYGEQEKTDDDLVEELAQDRSPGETESGGVCYGANFKMKYGSEVYNRIREIFTTTQAERAKEMRKQATIQRMMSM